MGEIRCAARRKGSHGSVMMTYAAGVRPIPVCWPCWEKHCDDPAFDLRDHGAGWRKEDQDRPAWEPRAEPPLPVPPVALAATGTAWLGDRAYQLAEGLKGLKTRKVGFGLQHLVTVDPDLLSYFEGRTGKVSQVAAKAIRRALT